MIISNMLKEVEFGPEAIDYLGAVLAQGRTLSAALPLFKFSSGRCFSYLPESTPPEIASKFAVGGVVPLSETEEATASFIEKYLRKDGRRCLILEDVLARPEDPNLASSSQVFFTAGEGEVYYFLDSATSTRSKIVDALRSATSHVLVGVLTRLPEGARAPKIGEEVPPEFLHQCAGNAEFILVGAYDGEGVLIWSS